MEANTRILSIAVFVTATTSPAWSSKSSTIPPRVDRGGPRGRHQCDVRSSDRRLVHRTLQLPRLQSWRRPPSRDDHGLEGWTNGDPGPGSRREPGRAGHGHARKRHPGRRRHAPSKSRTSVPLLDRCPSVRDEFESAVDHLLSARTSSPTAGPRRIWTAMVGSTSRSSTRRPTMCGSS